MERGQNHDFDDDFIDILNGFEATTNSGKVFYTPEDIFLDGTGAPTDKFLEALKMERDIITSRDGRRTQAKDSRGGIYDIESSDDGSDRADYLNTSSGRDEFDDEVSDCSLNKNDNSDRSKNQSNIGADGGNASTNNKKHTAENNINNKQSSLNDKKKHSFASLGVRRDGKNFAKNEAFKTDENRDNMTRNNENKKLHGRFNNQKLTLSSSRYKFASDFNSRGKDDYLDDDLDDDLDEEVEEEGLQEDNDTLIRENVGDNGDDLLRAPESHSNRTGFSKAKVAGGIKNSNISLSSPSSDGSERKMKLFEEKRLEFEELSRKVLSIPIADNSAMYSKSSISNLDLQKQLISVVNELRDIMKGKEAMSKNSFLKPTSSSNSKMSSAPSIGDRKQSSSSNFHKDNNSNLAVPSASNEAALINLNHLISNKVSANTANSTNNESNNNNNNNNNIYSNNNNSNNNISGVNDTKYKSLNLRLHGQMNTIKILELQIQEFNLVLQEKEKIINHLQSQVKLTGSSTNRVVRAVSPGYGNQYPQAGGRSKYSKTSAQANEENLLKVKAQMKEIESRHNADLVRYKLLKEYAEKAKCRVNELDSKVTEISQENVDLKEKFTRAKKELKDRINECALYQENNVEHLKTINNMKLYVSETEEEVSKLRFENNKMKSEIQNLKMEIKLGAENSKNSKMEIEILRERLDNRKTETKLFSLISGNNAVLNPSTSLNDNISSKYGGSYDNLENHSMKVVQRSKLMTFSSLRAQGSVEEAGNTKKPPSSDYNDSNNSNGFLETAMRNRRHKHEIDFSQVSKSIDYFSRNNWNRTSDGGGVVPSSRNNYRSRSLSPASRSRQSNHQSGSNAANSSGDARPDLISKAVRYSFDTSDRPLGFNSENQQNVANTNNNNNNDDDNNNNYNNNNNNNNKNNSNNNNNNNNNSGITTSNNSSVANNPRSESNSYDSDDDSDFDSSAITGSRTLHSTSRLLSEEKNPKQHNNSNKYVEENDVSRIRNQSSNKFSDSVDTEPRNSNSFDTITSSAIKSKYEKLKRMYEKVNQK